MEEQDFKDSTTGKLNYNKEKDYYWFEPKKLPLEFEEDDELKTLLTDAALNLGKLNGLFINSKEDISMIMHIAAIKEAQKSSEIEGTEATLSDVYKSDKEKLEDKEKELDAEEIKNYKRALIEGLDSLKTAKVSEDLIKKLHFILLYGVRGSDKTPGEYKKRQNYIGKKEDTYKTAKFVPASPESVPKLMDNLIKFINENNMNNLYKIALTHYQIETIHPFLDGNGRIGRLMIILLLNKYKLLDYPILYISNYFNSHKEEYAKKLLEASAKGKILDWMKFFFKVINIQANKSLELFKKIYSYKNELKEIISKKYNSSKLIIIINNLFKNPFIKIEDIVDEFKISHPAASKIIHLLEKEGIIEEVTGRKKNKLYLANKIMRILEM